MRFSFKNEDFTCHRACKAQETISPTDYNYKFWTKYQNQNPKQTNKNYLKTLKKWKITGRIKEDKNLRNN